MSKINFGSAKSFKIGTVFNSIGVSIEKCKSKLKAVTILFPSRLNAMALDPSKILINKFKRYSPGEIIIKVKIYKKVTIHIISISSIILISKRSKRKPLIMHAALLMKKALQFSEGLEIDVDNGDEIKHIGLGSSSGLIAAVACAINEIFGKPIGSEILACYLAQNHGEEIDEDADHLIGVQCIGGSAIGGLYNGGLHIIAGETKTIASVKIDTNYKVVLGVPLDFSEADSKILLKKEIENFPKFLACGHKYGPIIAYRLIHEAIPQMLSGDLHGIGNLIYDYRFKMGSIKNCSFTHPKLNYIAKKISFLKIQNKAEILSLSSVGPSYFAVSRSPKYCADIFRKHGMKTIIVDVENDSYKILWKKTR